MFLSVLSAFGQTQVGTLGGIIQPTYMAIDTDAGGTRWLYVSQHGDVAGNTGGVVLKFNLTTGATTGIPITSRGTGDGQFIEPDGIAVEPVTHDLFISDRYQSRIQRLHNDGTFVMKWGTSTAGAPNEMHGPCGLALDSAGALYVAEHGDYNGDPSHLGQHLDKYTFSGSGSSATANLQWKIGSWGSGPGQFLSTGPYGVVVTGGMVYVGDAFNNRVQVFDTATGTYQREIDLTGGAQPLGLSLDASGALWIGETSNSAPGSYDGGGTLQQAVKYSTSGTYAGVTLPGVPNNLSAFHAVVDPVTNKAYVTNYAQSSVAIFDLGTTSGGGSAPVVSNATVTGTIGTPIATVQVAATNAPTSFSAPGLAPYGLSISSTGVISGTPTATATNATVAVTATNGSGTSTAATITLNLTPGSATPPTGPVVTSFSYVAHTLTFEITFSEPVTGVDFSDFVFTQTGYSTGQFNSVTQVDPSHYTLNFTFFSGAPGSFVFDLKTSGTGIVGVNSGLPYTGAGITKAVVPVTPHLETNPPTVVSFQPGTPSGNTVNFLVLFSKESWNVQPQNITINTTGTATARLGYIVPADNTSKLFAIPVTYSGTGTISLTLSNATQQTISDGNYNMYVGPDTSTVFTIPATSGSVPVVYNAVVSGTVGTPITPVQVYATNSPTSYTAALSAYGLAISSSGLITGTPTAAAANGTVSVTATNASGTSSPATITLELAAGAGGGGGTPSVPVVSNATVTGTVGTPITNVQVAATNSPTSFSASGLAAYGLSINASGVISGTPTSAATNGTVTVTASNSAGTSAPATITLNLASAPTGGGAMPPVVSNATVNGTVGTPIATVQVSATNSPTSFSAPGLAAYGLTISNAGVISGTPTATASNLAVSVTASNSAGTSTVATLTLNLAAAPTGGGATPPVVANTTVSGTVGTPITTVHVVATNSPTSFSASGLATYGLSISSSGAITGTPTKTATNAIVSVTASNAAGTSAAATITLNLAPAVDPLTPYIIPATLSFTAGTEVNYQVQASNNPTSFTMSGAPAGLTISNAGVISGTPTAAGTYIVGITATNSTASGSAFFTVVVTSGTGGTTKKPQTITFLSGVSNLFVGDTVLLTATSTSGLPITYSLVSGDATLFGSTLVVNSTNPVVVRAAQAGNATWAAATADTLFTAVKKAQVLSTVLIPTLAHTDGHLVLNATSNAGLPVTYSIVSGPATVTGNTLTFTGSGTVVVRATQTGNGTYASTSSDVTITANPVPRLINLSARANVSANDAAGSTIAGFVVTGSEPKQILIRAVGPGLANFSVAQPLPDPTLKLYDNKGNLVVTNSGWNDDPSIAAASAATGAFKLTAGSKDAAVLVTLAPGAYTTQVMSVKNSGNVLVEVYDVSANVAVPTQQLINISTRAVVGSGDDAVIGGFVVAGNEPKKVLIRAVGPGLTAFHVNGVLADPVLTVYNDQHAVIATNDNWETQVAPTTAADIAAADTATGAFSLTAGSADSALVLTLAPGAYSAVVTGAHDSAGNALVEVYEVPTP